MAARRNGRVGGPAARLAAAAPALLLSAVLGACGIDTSSSVSGPPAPGPVVVGAADTVESELIARLYAGALEASGRSAELVLGLGDRADRVAALDANRVGLVPEYTGRLLHWFDPDAEATGEEEVYEALTMSLPAGLAVGEYAPADDRSVLVLPADAAARSGAATIAELAPECPRLTLHASDAFGDGGRAPDRLAAVYGCTFGAVVPAETATEVASSLADARAVGGITAAAPATGDDGFVDELVTLADPDDAFTAQNVVPLFRSDALRADDVRALSVVMQLTTSDLAEMAARIRGGEVSSADAAVEWLDDKL